MKWTLRNWHPWNLNKKYKNLCHENTLQYVACKMVVILFRSYNVACISLRCYAWKHFRLNIFPYPKERPNFSILQNTFNQEAWMNTIIIRLIQHAVYWTLMRLLKFLHQETYVCNIGASFNSRKSNWFEFMKAKLDISQIIAKYVGKDNCVIFLTQCVFGNRIDESQIRCLIV